MIIDTVEYYTAMKKNKVALPVLEGESPNL